MSNPRLAPSLEPLEARIAPANTVAILGARTATFVEADGDVLTIKTTRGSLSGENFRVGDFLAGGVTEPKLSVLLDSETFGREFAGTDLRITVEPGPAGNGRADIGWIAGNGISLGVVSVEGSLVSMEAEDVRVLRVDSLGVTGRSYWTQVNGSLGRLEVAGDLNEAYLHITGNLGSAKVGGNLVGGEEEYSGTIFVEKSMGPVRVEGSLLGGAGRSSGFLGGNGPFGTITIGGSLIGGSNFLSGTIYGPKGMGAVSIEGSVVGGTGPSSGALMSDRGVPSIAIGESVLGGIIFANGTVPVLSVGGSLVGGDTFSAGYIHVSTVRVLSIGGSIVGGDGSDSGRLLVDNGAGTVSIGGSVLGGNGPSSGSIAIIGSCESLRIGEDIRGGGNGSAHLQLQHVGQFRLGGSLLGGEGIFSAVVEVEFSVGSVKIGGDIRGDGPSSAQFHSKRAGSIDIAGSVIGIGNQFSAFVDVQRTAGLIHVGGDVAYGASVGGGDPTVSAVLGSLVIDGSLDDAFVHFAGAIGSVKVAHDVIGGSIGPGEQGHFGSGVISAVGPIGRVFIGGSLLAGTDNSEIADLDWNGRIYSEETLGPVRIMGDVIGTVGSGGDRTFAGISAGGQVRIGNGSTRDVAISSVEVGGDMVLGQILGGYIYYAAINADAQIGHITVEGDWIGSEVRAGVVPSSDAGGYEVVSGVFVRDRPGVISSIGEILIKGRVLASEAAPEVRSGFAAQQIISFRADGSSLPLTSRTDGPFLFGPGGSFGRVEEV